MVLRWFVLEKKNSLFLHPFKFRPKWEHEFFCCSCPLFALFYSNVMIYQNGLNKAANRLH